MAPSSSTLRLHRRQVLGGILGAAAIGVRTAAAAVIAPPQVGPDGLWAEDFYQPTSGDLVADAGRAAAAGKVLALFWERAGCDYGAILHLVALRDPAIRDYLERRFYAVRLDFYGRRPVGDFGGGVLAERDLAATHAVTGTPTIEFRIADGREVYRMPGYAEPPIMRALFDYVHRAGYLAATDAEWLGARGLL